MNAIICHGTLGSPEGNWFPWLSQELRQLGINVFVPSLPTPEGQSLSTWLGALEAQCPPITEQSILVGHSSGAVLCMRLLEKLPRPVKCTVLVAPPLKQIGIPEIDALNNSFLEKPFAWQVIRQNAGELAFLMGDDDQYVPQEQLLAIANSLDVSPIIIAKGGHLNAETGYTEFPSVLELLRVVLEGGTITRTWHGREDLPHN